MIPPPVSGFSLVGKFDTDAKVIVRPYEFDDLVGKVMHIDNDLVEP